MVLIIFPSDCKIKIVPDNENIVLTAKKVLNENAEFGVRDEYGTTGTCIIYTYGHMDI